MTATMTPATTKTVSKARIAELLFVSGVFAI
jgi:hypothetical protein